MEIFRCKNLKFSGLTITEFRLSFCRKSWKKCGEIHGKIEQVCFYSIHDEIVWKKNGKTWEKLTIDEFLKTPRSPERKYWYISLDFPWEIPEENPETILRFFSNSESTWNNKRFNKYIILLIIELDPWRFWVNNSNLLLRFSRLLTGLH